MAGILARRMESAVHLESDAFFRFIVSGYVEPWRAESHDQNRLVMNIVGDAAIAYAEGAYLTIVDGIVIPRWFLGPLRDTLHASGHEVLYVVLRAPLPDCLARIQAREGEVPIDSEAIGQIWAQFTDLGELERNVLEVSGMGPAEAAAATEQALAAGRFAI